MWAKLTLIGLYKYCNENGEDLFENLSLPEGIEKDLVINKILIEGGEFPLVYTDPTFIKNYVGTWSRIHERTFLKWITALNIEYEPLYNYDRLETRSGITTKSGEDTSRTTSTDIATDTTNHNSSYTGSKDTRDLGNNTENKALNGNGTRTTSGTETHDVSAYNSTADYEKDTKNTTSGNESTTSTVTESNSYSHTNTVTETDTNTTSGANATNHSASITEDKSATTSDNINNSETVTIKGNIGVTTSQQMLKDELNIARWNIYKNIAELFVEDFCIPIYL